MAPRTKESLPPATSSVCLLQHVDLRRFLGQRLGRQLELRPTEARYEIGRMAFEKGVDRLNVEHAPRAVVVHRDDDAWANGVRSEEHTSELQSRQYLVCRLLLEKKNQTHT